MPKAIVTAIRMSDQGYWVVDVSIAPARNVSIMVADTGISPELAKQRALAAAGMLPEGPP